MVVNLPKDSWNSLSSLDSVKEEEKIMFDFDQEILNTIQFGLRVC